MKGAPRPPLARASLHEHPMDQFSEWLEDVREEEVLSLPEAACLSTVGEDGYPQGRMILLKGWGRDGFVFYTNLESPKADSIRNRSRAALTLYWEPVRRQVRADGDVEPLSDEQADAYFARRPRGSQIGAWASDQSRPAEGREALDRSFAEARARFEGVEEIPRPPHWSGFRIRPRAVEFWQEGPDRMHDRFRYVRRGGDGGDGGGWEVVRLFP